MASTEIYNAIKCIPEHQRSIIMPQVEQFDMEATPLRFGVLGKVHTQQANGWCWAASIDDDCLITAVRIALVDDLPFYEQPEIEYSCVSLLSTASARLMDAIWAHDEQDGGTHDVKVRPSSAPLLEAETERAMAFTMQPRRYESPLCAGTTHAGVSVHLFPEYFEKLKKTCPGELSWLKETFDKRIDATASLELRSILRSIGPRQANLPGARLHYEGKALEAVSALIRFASNANEGDDKDATSLSDRVKELLATSLDKPPSLDELASACYTSRTALCTEFKRSCGVSIGTYLAGMRVARAKTLLASSEESIASIGRLVGYRHASTFACAFSKACGMSPRDWRKAQREELSESKRSKHSCNATGCYNRHDVLREEPSQT